MVPKNPSRNFIRYSHKFVITVIIVGCRNIQSFILNLYIFVSRESSQSKSRWLSILRGWTSTARFPRIWLSPPWPGRSSLSAASLSSASCCSRSCSGSSRQTSDPSCWSTTPIPQTGYPLELTYLCHGMSTYAYLLMFWNCSVLSTLQSYFLTILRDIIC